MTLLVCNNETAAKRKLQDKSSDSKMAKKARKLAEESVGQKNTILRHLQSGVAAPRAAFKSNDSKPHYACMQIVTELIVTLELQREIYWILMHYLTMLPNLLLRTKHWPAE
jgi:hypothetical protein